MDAAFTMVPAMVNCEILTLEYTETFSTRLCIFKFKVPLRKLITLPTLQQLPSAKPMNVLLARFEDQCLEGWMEVVAWLVKVR